MHSPKVVFLDEPTAALDPIARREIRSLIRRIARSGAAVVFTSHDMEEVEKLADRVVFLRGGRVRAAGTPEELKASYEVKSLDDLYVKLVETGQA